jgi:membrane glycosyltransferase
LKHRFQPARKQDDGSEALMMGLQIRRLLYAGLVASTTLFMTLRLWIILRVDGLSPLEYALLILFAILSARVASSFWLSGFGLIARLRIRWRGAKSPPAATRVVDAPPVAAARVAVVMPIYNEDVARSFAGILAVRNSVIRAGAARSFQFFVLSDSTNERCWRAEQREWLRLRAECGSEAPLYYRHRARNIGRKSGNIADFCRNWGASYEYMVVLDADSLMSGETLVALVRQMDASPGTALIQVPPRLIGRRTLFARLQQFASSVYGPILSAGMATLHGPDGNYWGHNAILRMKPFREHCGLPELPGRAPIGGEILSHDFVEAALLRRAGWEVRMSADLTGSYEEVPPTVVDYLKRDRRWCQGNLQHIRLIWARGFRLSSRMHFAGGALAYLASPLWLALLVVAAVDAYSTRVGPTVEYFGRYPVLFWPVSHTLELLALFFVTMAMLFGPKLFGLLSVIGDRALARAHGGWRRLLSSALLEAAYSALLAPVFMLSHTWFVLRVFFGMSVSWDGQQRRERTIAVGSAAAIFAPHTALAATSALLVYRCIPHSVGWFVPLLLGLLLAIPMARLTSSVRLGEWAARRGLFLIPSETRGLSLLTSVRSLVAQSAAGRLDSGVRHAA